MEIQLSKIDRKILQVPANYAKEKGVDRKYIYQLFKDDIIDFIEIDGVKFVYLNQKAKGYKKIRNL